mgnify:CR=1 FL=1
MNIRRLLGGGILMALFDHIVGKLINHGILLSCLVSGARYWYWPVYTFVVG